jgi:alpha-beta hydrolase superfamily lysophospholipase
MSEFNPVILIHGAWQGSWAWARFTPYLEAAGFITRAIDLPGNGVDSADPALSPSNSGLIIFMAWSAPLTVRSAWSRCGQGQ